MTHCADDLGERIALVLSRTGGRASALARASGISDANLTSLVRCERPAVTLTELSALLRALRCTPDWLLGLSPDGAPPYAELRREFASILAHQRRRPALPRAGRRSTQRIRSVCIAVVARQLQMQEERRQARQIASTTRSQGHHPLQVPVATRDLGARLAGLLTEAGIARAELARVTGLTEGAVDELCRGRRKDVDAREIAMIAKTLGCSASWLLGIDGDPPTVARVWASFALRGGRRRVGPSDAVRLARGPEDLVPLHDPRRTANA